MKRPANHYIYYLLKIGSYMICSLFSVRYPDVIYN